LKSCKEWGERGERGGKTRERGGEKKHSVQTMLLKGVQCGAGKKTSATSRTANISSPSNIELKT